MYKLIQDLLIVILSKLPAVGCGEPSKLNRQWNRSKFKICFSRSRKVNFLPLSRKEGLIFHFPKCKFSNTGISLSAVLYFFLSSKKCGKQFCKFCYRATSTIFRYLELSLHYRHVHFSVNFHNQKFRISQNLYSEISIRNRLCFTQPFLVFCKKLFQYLLNFKYLFSNYFETSYRI